MPSPQSNVWIEQDYALVAHNLTKFLFDGVREVWTRNSRAVPECPYFGMWIVVR
jgi:hypothetical protein